MLCVVTDSYSQLQHTATACGAGLVVSTGSILTVKQVRSLTTANKYECNRKLQLIARLNNVDVPVQHTLRSMSA